MNISSFLRVSIFLGCCTLPLMGNATSGAGAQDAASVSGEVVQVKDVDSYTYLLLKTKDGTVWAAVNKAPLNEGASVTIENVTEMRDFESKTLKKTFPSILFGTLAGSDAEMVGAHASLNQAEVPVPAQMDKASGANAQTVAQVVTHAAQLKGQTVQVRGKIVKYNPNIMDKNWIHVRDGSGTAADKSNDLLVTTSHSARLGDTVTVSGVVVTDRDFGSGYAYAVLIEDATLAP